MVEWRSSHSTSKIRFYARVSRTPHPRRLEFAGTLEKVLPARFPRRTRPSPRRAASIAAMSIIRMVITEESLVAKT
jgi:hypothetical protein